MTFAVDAGAQQLVDGLADRLAVSDEERVCVVRHVSQDQALLDRARGGVAPVSPEFSAIAGFVQQCKISVTFAPRFANDVNDARGGALSDEQRSCLRIGFTGLTGPDLDAVMASGLDPTGSIAPRGSQVLAELLARCGVLS